MRTVFIYKNVRTYKHNAVALDETQLIYVLFALPLGVFRMIVTPCHHVEDKPKRTQLPGHNLRMSFSSNDTLPGHS